LGDHDHGLPKFVDRGAQKFDGRQRPTVPAALKTRVGILVHTSGGRVIANGVLLYITIDHQVIFAWAQQRGACPSILEGDERPWPLFFNFSSADADLKEISWDKFFEEFERAALAFVYQDATPNSELDDWHEFVKRAAVPELVISGKSTITEKVI
jgi:hypothetical protein